MDPFKKFEEVDRWKDYFDSTGKDVFEVMEFAIKVASRFRPAGLLQRRSALAEKLFTALNDDEDSDEDFEDTTEDGEELAQTENSSVASIDEEQKERPRHIIRIKLKPKAQTENTNSTSIDEEHQEKPCNGDIVQEEPRRIIRIKLKPKEDVRVLDHKQEETNRNGNNVDLAAMLSTHPRLRRTIRKLPFQSVKANSEESTMEEKMVEANRRNNQAQYEEEFNNKMKRIKLMDFENIATPKEGVGSCSRNIRRRPVVYRIRRTIM